MSKKAAYRKIFEVGLKVRDARRMVYEGDKGGMSVVDKKLTKKVMAEVMLRNLSRYAEWFDLKTNDMSRLVGVGVLREFSIDPSGIKKAKAFHGASD